MPQYLDKRKVSRLSCALIAQLCQAGSVRLEGLTRRHVAVALSPHRLLERVCH
jgi:hypothetical protein